MKHARTVARIINQAEMVAHFAARFDIDHAIRVCNPIDGKRYSRSAVAAARLMLERVA